jgi:hypothetical protein
MKKNFLIVGSLIILLSFLYIKDAQAQQNNQKKPLEAMKRFEGNWVAPDTAKIYKLDPSRKGNYFFGFRMIGNADQCYMLEDFGPTRKDTVFVGLIAPNPLTGRLEIFGSNVRDGFLFKGVIDELSPDGFTRHYDVYYPKDHPIAKQAGQVVTFRERFVLLDPNTLEFDIEFFSKAAQAWRKWSQVKHIVVRKQ